jgi:hypothetical protein
MILHGRNILLLAGGTAIAAAKSCTLRVSDNAIPIASPTSGAWEDAIPGRKSWQASCGQLVTGITDAAAMVGTVVTLRMQIKGEIGLPFDDFVDGETVQTGTYDDVEAVVWDKTAKKFLGVVVDGTFQELYYANWNKVRSVATTSTMYANQNVFHFRSARESKNNNVYKRTSTDIIPEALQGSAIVQEWDVSGNVGNLAQGSFSFLGKGALAVPTT